MIRDTTTSTNTATAVAMAPLRRSLSCPPTFNATADTSKKRPRRRHSWNGMDATALIVNEKGETIRTTDRNAYRRKAEAMLKGGAMVGAGLMMIPLPVPLGLVGVGAGLSVIGKEFPSVKKFLDNTKGAVNGFMTAKQQETVMVVPEKDETTITTDKESEVVVFGDEYDDNDYSWSEAEPFQSYEEDVVMPKSCDYDDGQDEIIFSSAETSETFDDGTKRLEKQHNTFISVWSA